MRGDQRVAKDIDEYIANYPTEVRAKLEKIRATINKAAPKAEEVISYQIPAFRFVGRPFIFFAAYKKHIAVYPAPRTVPEFAEELAGYEGGKGTVQFPLDQPIPYDLIRRIAKFRLAEYQERAATKAKKK
jgi:uncharacterized protein YdhG (YjbR/CyaY superfamily)